MEELRSGSSVCRVSHRGAFVSSLKISNMEILKRASDGYVTHGGMAILVPYADIVADATYTWQGRRYQLPRNAGYEGNVSDSIHGLVKSAYFSVIYRDADSILLKHTLAGPGYPSRLNIYVNYAIQHDSLNSVISVENTGNNEAPLVCGAHPYFLYSDFWSIKFSNSAVRLFSGGNVSSRMDERVGYLSKKIEGYYDDSFFGGGTILLLSSDRMIEIDRRSMPYFEIYDGKYADGRSVAVEPMTGAPNAYNNKIGLISLKPGETFLCGFDIRVRPI